ncbi:AAA family ATPase [Methanobrevibacter sp.]|uniref:AAA family ATPase n=1 Tax=Methanobrevibacter sp. TaxID=66852 RepID=UPI003868A26B
MARKGLGKGLDSLFPDILNEDFDSNSAQSLEDMLKDEETVEEVVEDIESKEEEISQDVEEEDDSEDDESTDKDSEIQEEVEVDDGSSEDLSGSEGSEESVQTSPEIQVQKEHVDDVKKIVDKNPRITLWSSRSSAVLRYLRKTEPEFSISKEASILIEEAVSKKYPEIWELFKDL